MPRGWLAEGKKTLSLRVSQNLLFGAEALHTGFPSSLVRVGIFLFFYPVVQHQTSLPLPSPPCCAACGTSPRTACPAWEGNGQLRRLGLEGQRLVLPRLSCDSFSSTEATLLEESSCVSVVGKIILGFCPNLPIVLELQGLALEGDAQERRDF